MNDTELSDGASEYDRLKAQRYEIEASQYLRRKMSEPVYGDIRRERERQDEQWGGPEHDDGHTPRDWSRFLRKHVAKLSNFHIDDVQTYMGKVDDTVYDGPAPDFRERLVVIAALAVAALQSYDRKI